MELQPQIELSSGAITCVEALVRWQHPERGRVGPIEFIPFAEESHRILAIGVEVIRLACEARAALHEDLDDKVPIAINVSAVQLADPGFLDHFNEEVDRHALSGHQIELEITERARLPTSTRVAARGKSAARSARWPTASSSRSSPRGWSHHRSWS